MLNTRFVYIKCHHNDSHWTEAEALTFLTSWSEHLISLSIQLRLELLTWGFSQAIIFLFQIITHALALHVPITQYVSQSVKLNTTARANLANLMNQNHSATTTMSPTKASVNTSTRSVWIKKNPGLNTTEAANVSIGFYRIQICKMHVQTTQQNCALRE